MQEDHSLREPLADPSGNSGSIITLVQFPRVWGCNVSPFGLKLETWLRLSGLSFEVEESTRLNEAPKGKLPFIKDGPARIGDSTFIIDHLKRTRDIDPDVALTPRQRAEAIALQRLFEDHLYFILVYSRWLDPEGAATVSEAFFRTVPAMIRGLVWSMFRARMRKMLEAQGIGRHAPHEIYELARVDLEAVANYLGDKTFFMGEQLTTIDAVAFGFIANIVNLPIETELKRIATGFPNLVAWCESMEQGLYSEAS